MLQGLPLVQLTTHIGIGYVLHHAFQEAEASEIQGQITFFSRRAEKAKYLTKSSEVMRNFAGEKKKHSSTRAE